jgi:hypothetical protein
MNNGWFQRRWQDFRNGHSVYLSFALTFINFTVITFTLAVDRLPFLKELFPNMWHWAIFFICAYIPSAIIAGHFHMKKQVPREQEQLMDNNPFAFRTTPGKEQLFSIPCAIINCDLQLKTMNINNQIAEAFKKAYNIDIQKWEQKDFKNVEWMKSVSQRLLKGEDVRNILGEKEE